MIAAHRIPGMLLALLLTSCAVARPPELAPVELTSQGRMLATVGADGITLVLLDVRDHPRGFARLAALDHPGAVAGWSLEFEHGRIELWTMAGRLHGQARIGGRSARWRMRFEADGTLSPERWMVELDGDPRAPAAIRDARGISQELARAAEFDTSIDPSSRCRILEAIATLELGLGLALRTYERRGRSERLVWTSPELADACD